MSFHWLGTECTDIGGTRYELFYLRARLGTECSDIGGTRYEFPLVGYRMYGHRRNSL